MLLPSVAFAHPTMAYLENVLPLPPVLAPGLIDQIEVEWGVLESLGNHVVDLDLPDRLMGCGNEWKNRLPVSVWEGGWQGIGHCKARFIGVHFDAECLKVVDGK